MRRLILPLMLVVAVACQPAAAPLSDEDIAAIRSLGSTYAEAYVAGDIEAALATYTDDAIVMPPNAPAIAGKDALREQMMAELSSGARTTSFTLTSVAIEGAGDLAFERGTWSWTGTLPGATDSTTDVGKYVVIVRRQADGSWLVAVDVYNSDTPLPESE